MSAEVDVVGTRALERLARIVAEDALAELHRQTDRLTNEARRVVAEAEERVAGMASAARRLGAARGAAVETAVQRAAEAEATAVARGAFEALLDRFVVRVRLALAALPGTPRHAAALASWAREAAGKMDRPTDVHVEAPLRSAVYEALLTAGARDFRVHADARVHVGFVVRDLDGRTVFDARPESLVAAHREELADLLRASLPAPPPLPA